MAGPTTDIYPLLANSLTKNLNTAYRDAPRQWDKLVHVNTTNRRIVDVQSWIGRGMPAARDPRESIVYDGIAPNFSKRHMMIGYTQAEALAEEDILDDEAGVLLKWCAARGSEFATAWRTLEETLVFSYLGITAFGTAPVAGSPDGQPYASASHPMSRLDTTTTFSNLLAVDLSPTSFRQARALLEKQLKPNGITFMNNTPAVLLVNPDLREMATRLLQGDWTPDTTDRNMNVNKGIARLVVSPYFRRAGTLGAQASPVLYNGWVVQGQEHFLEWYWREKPIFREWADNARRARVYASHMRCELGHDDARGIIFGSGT